MFLSDFEATVTSMRITSLQKCGILRTHVKKQGSPISSSLHKSSKLVFVPFITGFADRLLGIASLFLLSVAFNRTFHISYLPSLHLEDLRQVLRIPFENDIFSYDLPEWTIKRFMENYMIRGGKKNIITYGIANESYYIISAIDDNFEKNGVLASKVSAFALGNHTKYHTVIVSLNHGVLFKLYKSVHTSRILKNTAIPEQLSFGCAIRYLFVPKIEIFKPFSNQLSQLMSGIRHKTLSDNKTVQVNIAIHIRVGDIVFSSSNDTNTVSRFQHYFDCANKVEKKIFFSLKYLNTTSLVNFHEYFQNLNANSTENTVIFKWYLFTDSISLRKDAVATYGDKIVTSIIAVEHTSGALQIVGKQETPQPCLKKSCVSKQGFSNAVAEWWMIGEADFFVIGDNSGYGKTAAFRAYKRKTIYTVKKIKHRRHVKYTCTDDDFENFRGYSGI